MPAPGRPLRRILAAVVPLLLVVALLAGCGKSSSASSSAANPAAGNSATGAPAAAASCPTTETKPLAKTKFVLHASLASGAFVHWIYTPFKAKQLHLSIHNASHIAKAALAGAFVVHELKQAKTDALGDPTLCKVVIAPIQTVSDAFSSVVGKIRHGDVDASNLAPVVSGFSSLKNTASSLGSSITDKVPSAGQLANPSSTGS